MSEDTHVMDVDAESVGSVEVPASNGTNSAEKEAPESRELNRDAILDKAFVPELERVEVPEWGGHVFVKEMSGRQRDAWEKALVAGKGNNKEVDIINSRAKLVAATTVDSKGRKLFSDEDVKLLGEKSSRALQRVFRVSQKLSGVSDDDIEELAGELGEGRSSGSGTS